MSKVVLFAAVLLLVAGIATAGILDPEQTLIFFGDATGGDIHPGPTAPPWVSNAFPDLGAATGHPSEGPPDGNSGPGCYFACPQGDTDTFANSGNFLRPLDGSPPPPGVGPGMSVEFACKDALGAPIPDIPRSDFWLIDNNNNTFGPIMVPNPPNPPTPFVIPPLFICVGAACIDADAASDQYGWAEIEDETFKVGSCTDNLAAVVQGFVITTLGVPVNLHIETRSVDMDASGDVQLADLALFSATFPPNVYHACGDFDCSNVVGLPDLARFAFHFGPPGHACQ